MSRYTKSNSNYLLTKKHQFTNSGTIWERDWFTIGERHRLDPGKRAFTGSGNFLFTTSTIVSDRRKNRFGKWTASLVGDDIVLKDAASDSAMPINMLSHDLADYAYYGSLVELFRSSVENIIREFPGNITTYGSVDSKYGKYLVRNQFDIDLYHDDVVMREGANELRYLSYSWRNYRIFDGSSWSGITGYSIEYVSDTTIECAEDGETIYDVSVLTDSSEFHLYGIKNEVFDDGRGSYRLDFYTDTQGLVIEPVLSVVEEYFTGLPYFEAVLLNRMSNPPYSNRFLVPKQLRNGKWKFVPRRFTWPSDGYCIDISSYGYGVFVEEMIRTCGLYDEISCDSIWRCMTHESIKNFDRTYGREYGTENVEDRIVGGGRIEAVLRCYGRFFDEIKYYIDAMGHSERVDYDGYYGAPTEEYPEILEEHGWEVYGTLWNFYSYVRVEAEDVPSDIEPVEMPSVPDMPSAGDPTYIVVSCSEHGDAETPEYYILVSVVGDDTVIGYDFINGTVDSSELIAKENPWISDNSTGCFLVRRAGAPGSVVFDEDNTFSFVPTALDADMPEWLRVIDNKSGGYNYYQKVSSGGFDDFNSGYLHDRWFYPVNADMVDRRIVESEFMKRMILSSASVWRAKGTLHSVDMVMGMFGFGRSENDDESDYTLTEFYRKTEGRRIFDDEGSEELYYYYKSIPETHDVGIRDFDSVPEYATGDDEKFPPYIRVSEGGLDYFYHKESVSLAYLAYSITLDKTTANYEESNYSGFPLETVNLGDTSYVVPYYYHDRKYDGDFVFQSNGGWGKFDTDMSKPYGYQETISYLHVIGRIGMLFDVDINGSESGDVYYVSNISDYEDYFGTPVQPVTHYFVLKDVMDVSSPSGWANIPMEGAITYQGYEPVSDREASHEDYMRAKYLDGIIPFNMGNNPHCGYGRYDGGAEFVEYMHQPYKYLVDNYAFNDLDANYDKAKHFLYRIFGPDRYVGDVVGGPSEEASEVIDISSAKEGEWYRVSHGGYVNGVNYGSGTLLVVSEGEEGNIIVPFGRKVLDYLYEARYVELEDEPVLPKGYWNSTNTYEDVPSFVGGRVYNSSPEYIRVSADGSEYSYWRKVVEYGYGGEWVINDKVLIFRNNIDNNLYKSFFRSVIMPYLMQVVPSTAILFFEGLEYERKGGEMFELTVRVAEESEGLGVVRGSGRYGECAKVTVSAIPGEHSVFVEWRDCGTKEQIGTDAVMEIRMYQDRCVEAVFEEMCHVTYDIVEDGDGDYISGNPLEMGYIMAGGARITPGERYYYTDGSSVSLKAVPSPCCEFAKWVDGESGEEYYDNPHTFDIGKDDLCGGVVSCVFGVREVEISVTSDEHGSAYACNDGDTECGVECGDEVTIWAVPDEGYSFLKWVDCDDESVVRGFENPYTFVANEDDCFKAVFQSVGVVLTISASPGEGGTSNFTDGAVLTAGGSRKYNMGDTAVITAVPNTPCFKFEHWFDVYTEETDDNAVKEVVMDGDKEFMAFFSPVEYTLTVGEYDRNSGDVVFSDTNCNGRSEELEYDCGTELSVTAVPMPGFCFEKWEVVDNPEGQSVKREYRTETISLVMDRNIKITPSFTNKCQSLIEVVYSEVSDLERKEKIDSSDIRLEE